MNQTFTKAIDHGLASCHTCGKVAPIAKHKRCPRCRSRLHSRQPNSVRNTMVLLASALALYIPANLLPILTVTELGEVTHNTIVTGMISFWNSGAYPIAIVIFCASILIPILKIGSLCWLCAAATGKVNPSPSTLSKLHCFTELLGRWSMVDIFVVAILVSLVQLGNYMTIIPGPGAIAFALVVILTMSAAMTFDPRLLWDRLDELADASDKSTAPHQS